MRSLRLARVAAEAEGLFLRRSLRRAVLRAAIGAVAALFAVAAFAVLHVLFWLHMAPIWGPERSGLVLLGIDGGIAVILAFLATFWPSDGVMTSAVTVRDQALKELRGAFTLSAMVKPLLGIFFEHWLIRRRRKP
jgi:hypothetical protein